MDRVCLQLFRGCQQVVDKGPGGVWINEHFRQFSSRSPERLAAFIDSSRVETIKCEGRLRNLDVVSISINLLSLEIFALRFLQSHSVLSSYIEQVILRKAHIITMHALFDADGGEAPRGAYSGKCTMMMSPATAPMTRVQCSLKREGRNFPLRGYF